MDKSCVEDCTKCPELVESRTRIVNGVGPVDADILIIGEAPGETEDETGEPFVGRSGSELDSALEEAGSSRDVVRITNTVRCRPPDNRDPSKEERNNCFEFLNREISVVNPSVIIPVGKVPSETLLGRDVKITSEAGTSTEYVLDGVTYPVVLTPHPAAMFYNRSLEPVFYSAIETAVSVSE